MQDKLTTLKHYLLVIGLSRPLFAGILLIVALIASILNFNGQTMSGLIPAYRDFADFFASGLDFSQGKGLTIYTFPMWGYGLVFLVTKSKSTIIIFQQMVAIATLLFVDHSIERFQWKATSRLVFRALTVLSFQWFYFHAILWPYSLGANLLLLSSFLLLNYMQFKKYRWLLLAGLSFGVMLNFRSDYYYLGLAIPALVWIIDLIRNQKGPWWHYLSWYVVIFALLVPWGEYAIKKSGSYLQTSSNGGHVLFISLGQLPDNVWGITPLDTDAKMQELVNNEFGGGVRTLSHQADRFLTRKWLELILDNKSEFLRKCWFNLRAIYRSPFYNGELTRFSDGTNESVLLTGLDNKLQHLADKLAQRGSPPAGFGPVKRLYEKIGAFIPILTTISLLLVVFTVPFSVARKTPMILILFVIVYQLLLLVLAFNMNLYHTNVFVHYIVLLIFILFELDLLGVLSQKGLRGYDRLKRRYLTAMPNRH